MRLQKLATLFIIFLFVLNPFSAIAAEESNGGFVDDSLRDMTVVLGTGIGGAVLGLSTMSFVDEPSKHWRNVAVGGAIGIVVGVVVVVFSQAQNHSSISEIQTPMNLNNFDSIKRDEFKSEKIAKNYLAEPSVSYQFSF